MARVDVLGVIGKKKEVCNNVLALIMAIMPNSIRWSYTWCLQAICAFQESCGQRHFAGRESGSFEKGDTQAFV